MIILGKIMIKLLLLDLFLSLRDNVIGFKDLKRGIIYTQFDDEIELLVHDFLKINGIGLNKVISIDERLSSVNPHIVIWYNSCGNVFLKIIDYVKCKLF
jgi:hypothetical protein